MILTTTRDHRIAIVSDACSESRSEVPSGKDACKLVHVCLRVSRNGVALGIARRCAIEVEHVRTNREELEHFASKVLVRVCSRAETHIEILTHRWCECDLV